SPATGNNSRSGRKYSDPALLQKTSATDTLHQIRIFQSQYPLRQGPSPADPDKGPRQKKQTQPVPHTAFHRFPWNSCDLPPDLLGRADESSTHPPDAVSRKPPAGYSPGSHATLSKAGSFAES